MAVAPTKGGAEQMMSVLQLFQLPSFDIMIPTTQDFGDFFCLVTEIKSPVSSRLW